MEAPDQPTPPPDKNPLSTADARTLLGVLTEDELGRALKTSHFGVAKWRKAGVGPPYYRFQRTVLYRIADVTQWMLEQVIDPATGEYLLPQAHRLTPPPPRAPSSTPSTPSTPKHQPPITTHGDGETPNAGTIVTAAERLAQFHRTSG